MRMTPLDSLPDISDVQVIVSTDWSGRSPDLIEDQVTYPIVTALISTPRVKAVRESRPLGSHVRHHENLPADLRPRRGRRRCLGVRNASRFASRSAGRQTVASADRPPSWRWVPQPNAKVAGLRDVLTSVACAASFEARFRDRHF